MKSLLLSILMLILLIACGKESSKKISELTHQDVKALYQAKKIEIKVFYEIGAEPFTEGPLGFKFWNILSENLEALFPHLPAGQILVPKDLTHMSKISKKNKTSWSAADVQELASSLGASSQNEISRFNIFFVNGFSNQGESVIGFHVTGTNTMVVFKDVIKNSGQDPLGLVPKYVEQATLIHEMGHAVGLVSNGVPTTSSHHDSSHGHHCSNPECVMYYTNEGLSSMIEFLKRAGMTGSSVMFDKGCLDDTKKYYESMQ